MTWATILTTAAAGVATLAASYYLFFARCPHATNVALARPQPPIPAHVLATIDALSTALPDKVHTLSTRSHAFRASAKRYYSAQEQELIPAGIVQPASATDTARALRILASAHARTPLHFAVRSGGHALNAGEANVANGIVLDLSALNGVQVAPDRASALVGPAARWGDVYERLGREGLAVVGGRSGDVGVGGLALGGGLSFSSPRRGFVCDNVLAFEVALADGRVVVVDEREHGDLFIALKGGSNNFGVVTRFTLRAFPLGDVWAGVVVGWSSSTEAYIDAMARFGEADGYDPDSAGWFSVGYRWGLVIPAIVTAYMKPVKKPACFSEALSVPSVFSTTKIRSLTDMVREIGSYSVAGHRHLFSTTTFILNREMMHEVYRIFSQMRPAANAVRGSIASLVMQHILPSVTKHASSNAIGIETDTTLILVLVTCTWDDPRDDQTFNELQAKVIHEIEETAKERGLFHRFKYMNYCAPHQDPLAGYAEGKLEMMRGVAARYDPDGLFQTACVGGRKLT